MGRHRISVIFQFWIFIVPLLGLAQNETKTMRKEAPTKKIQWNLLPSMQGNHTARATDLWDTSAMLMWIPDRTFIGKIGIKVPLVEVALSKNNPEKIRMEVDLLTFNHMSKSATNHRFYLNTSDTKFGFHLDYLFQPWTLRLGAKHRSAHLADGLLSDLAIEKNSYPRKKGFSQEFVESYLIFNSDYVKPHLGITYVVRQGTPKNIRGRRFLGFQGGMDLTYSHSSSLTPILSMNFSASQELDFHVSQSYLAGLKISSQPGGNSLIVGLNYYDGADPRGEFFGDFVRFWGMSIQYLF